MGTRPIRFEPKRIGLASGARIGRVIAKGDYFQAPTLPNEHSHRCTCGHPVPCFEAGECQYTELLCKACECGTEGL